MKVADNRKPSGARRKILWSSAAHRTMLEKGDKSNCDSSEKEAARANSHFEQTQ
jgi:hypothetical protein